MKKVYIEGDRSAIVDNEARGVKEGYVMASINGGKFQSMHKDKILARVKKPLDQALLKIVR